MYGWHHEHGHCEHNEHEVQIELNQGQPEDKLHQQNRQGPHRMDHQVPGRIVDERGSDNDPVFFIEDLSKARNLESSDDEIFRLIALCLPKLRLLFSLCSSMRVYVYKTYPTHVMFAQASCSRALNDWMRGLYHSDSFIRKQDAMQLNKAGRHFMDGFSRLAFLSHQRGHTRYAYIPKVHMLWHLIDSMCSQASLHAYVFNPVAESCSVDEDMIGRFCLITRKVSPRRRGLRALERYLTQTLLVWERP